MEFLKELGAILKEYNEKNYGLYEEYVYITDTLLDLSDIKPEKRTNEDNLYLYDRVKDFAYFDKLFVERNKEINKTIFALIQKMKVKIIEPKEKIYSAGELIKNNIIILDGKINFYKHPTEPYEKIPIKIKYKKIDKDCSLSKKFRDAYNMIKYTRYNKNLLFVLKKGEIFNRNKITESDGLIEARTRCALGFIPIKEWQNILSKKEAANRNEIINFFQSITLFKPIQNPLLIESFISLIKKKNFRKGEFLVERDTEFKNIFLIRHGCFKVYFYNKKKMTTNYDINSIFNEKEPIARNSIDSKYYLKKCYIENIEYNLLSYGKGEIVGDIEYLTDSKNYVLNIKCDLDNSEVYQFPLDKFLKLSNRKMKNILMENATTKINYFKERIKDIKLVNTKQVDKRNKIKDFILDKLDKEEYKKNINKERLKKFSFNSKNSKSIFNMMNINNVNPISQKNPVKVKSSYKLRNLNLDTSNNQSYLQSKIKNDYLNTVINNENYSKDMNNENNISFMKYKFNVTEENKKTEIFPSIIDNSSKERQIISSKISNIKKANSISLPKNNKNRFNQDKNKINCYYFPFEEIAKYKKGIKSRNFNLTEVYNEHMLFIKNPKNLKFNNFIKTSKNNSKGKSDFKIKLFEREKSFNINKRPKSRYKEDINIGKAMLFENNIDSLKQKVHELFN